MSLGWLWGASRQAGSDLVASTRSFLASLSDAQRLKAQQDFALPQRAAWHYIPKPERKGLPLGEMQAEQRKRAGQMLESALSASGYGKATQIMELEGILRALEPQKPRGFRDPARYFFAVFGAPTSEGRWQLSIEGHHLSLNFVLDRGQVVSVTPAFFGANPAVVKPGADAGPPPGTRVLAQEELLAFELLAGLSAEQTKLCLIAAKAPRDIRAGGAPQPPQEPPAGIPWTKLDAKQQALLRRLLGVYLGNLAGDLAAEQWESIHAAGLEKIHFAWAGAKAPGVGHYYRIQGPTFVIELCNTQPDAAGNPANHVHTVLRRLPGDFAVDR